MSKLLYQVFLINNSKEIFVCLPQKKVFESENICAEGNSIEEAVLNIEDKWGILCEEGNLTEVFWTEQLKEGEIVDVNGFVIKMSLTEEQKEFLLEKSNCKFIKYSELLSLIDEYNTKSNLKNSIKHVIRRMQEN